MGDRSTGLMTPDSVSRSVILPYLFRVLYVQALAARGKTATGGATVQPNTGRPPRLGRCHGSITRNRLIF